MGKLHPWCVLAVALVMTMHGSSCVRNDTGISSTSPDQGRAKGAIDPNFASALGTPVGGKQWEALAQKFQMEHTRLKGEDTLESSEHGIKVFTRQVVWSIFLVAHPRPGTKEHPYAGPLPLGVGPDDSPADLIRKLGKPVFDEPQNREERWMKYVADGIEYTFAFTDPPVLSFVMVSKLGD